MSTLARASFAKAGPLTPLGSCENERHRRNKFLSFVYFLIHGCGGHCPYEMYHHDNKTKNHQERQKPTVLHLFNSVV